METMRQLLILILGGYYCSATFETMSGIVVPVPALIMAANHTGNIYNLYHGTDGMTVCENNKSIFHLLNHDYYRSCVLDLWAAGEIQVKRIVMSLLDESFNRLLKLKFRADGGYENWFSKRNLYYDPFEIMMRYPHYEFHAEGMVVYEKEDPKKGAFQVHSPGGLLRFHYVIGFSPRHLPLDPSRSSYVHQAAYLAIELMIDFRLGGPTSSNNITKPSLTISSTTNTPVTEQYSISETTDDLGTRSQSESVTATHTGETNSLTKTDHAVVVREDIHTECVTFMPNGSTSTVVLTWRLLNQAQIREAVSSIYDTLVIPPKSTCVYKRKLASATDYRSSSSLLGSVAILIISFVLGLIVLMDVTSWRSHCGPHTRKR